MIFNPPIAPAGPNQTFLNALGSTLRRVFVDVVTTESAVHRVMLRSPNGTVYQVTVSDAGALQVTLNDGKSRV